MKNLVKLVLVLAVMVITGCVSLERNAYRTLGTTATLVDGSMNAWGDWVRAGYATAADESKVKSAYQKYQQAMAMAKVVVKTAKASPTEESDINTALNVVSATSSEIVALIKSLTQKPVTP